MAEGSLFPQSEGCLEAASGLKKGKSRAKRNRKTTQVTFLADTSFCGCQKSRGPNNRVHVAECRSFIGDRSRAYRGLRTLAHRGITFSDMHP